ncbi:MAG: formate dehydrogenase [Chloroflexi bacterium]|nr:formate dehydrogenase [Chloroflexota bacterium]
MSFLSRVLNLGPGKSAPRPTAAPVRPYPTPDQWQTHREIDTHGVERNFTIVPATCFNCEAACGLLAYVDTDQMRIAKFEGNPNHPGSRGRNCAKGPATINQVYDPERILYPMKRVGERGSGRFERTTWDEALDAIAARIRAAFQEGRRNEIMYHVGRPGADGAMDRVLQAWGVDGHNSHTNVCSSSARLGYQLWMGSDRPVPDYANAKFILLLNSHLETGHYFNPYAQRITDARRRGTKVATVDTRLSNTASMSDYWLPTWPGSETTLVLAMARIIIEEGLVNRAFVEQWVNWEESLAALKPDAPRTLDAFLDLVKELYAEYTPEHAERESGVPAATIRDVAIEIGRAGSAFASYVWRNAASGNRGGWMVARALMLLQALTGAVGSAGGIAPNQWNKFVAGRHNPPPPQQGWNELIWPREFPLTHYEMSILLPHFVREGRGKVDTYFTRVYNPVWTNPDGFSWIEMLRDESQVGLHAALTPTWSESALFADYVLPMGLGPERHDLQSQETHHGQWIAFRQPVLRVARERMGETITDTREVNPGEVWEEDEFWIELSWRIDPDGSLGVRQYFESPYRPGEKVTVDEHYRWVFEHTIPGLPEAAAKEGLSPFDYMRKYGVFEVRQPGSPALHEQAGADGAPQGFRTPSKKLEFYSSTLRDWGWPELAYPVAVDSQVSRSKFNHARHEYALLPTFRLPTLIHTRSANAKWLNELSHANPLWMHPTDAAREGVETGSLARIETRIGYFVAPVYVTEGIRPGVVACSHHIGRWRLAEGSSGDRSFSGVSIQRRPDGRWMMRQQEQPRPYASDDPDTLRRWWTDGGVNQNLTFPVQPDPVSGMHCWHQAVTVRRAEPGDRVGDVLVDTQKAHEAYREWMAQTRPAPGPGGLRRPLWFTRPVKPADGAYYLS